MKRFLVTAMWQGYVVIDEVMASKKEDAHLAVLRKGPNHEPFYLSVEEA